MTEVLDWSFHSNIRMSVISVADCKYEEHTVVVNVWSSAVGVLAGTSLGHIQSESLWSEGISKHTEP